MKKISLSSLAFEPREGYERSVIFGPDEFHANAKLQVIRLAPHTSIRRHVHAKRTEVFIILEGEGVVSVANNSINVAAKEFILCQPGDVHEIVNDSGAALLLGVFRTHDPGNKDMIWVKGESDGK